MWVRGTKRFSIITSKDGGDGKSQCRTDSGTTGYPIQTFLMANTLLMDAAAAVGNISNYLS